MTRTTIATFSDKEAARQVFEGLRKADCVAASDHTRIWYSNGVIIEMEDSDLLKITYLIRSDATCRCQT
jgi:hypothetical protein